MHKRKLNNYLPNVIVTIIMSFSILAFVLVNLFSAMVLNPATYTNAMNKSDVGEQAYNEIIEFFDRQQSYTGIDAELLKKSVSKESVSESIYAYVDSTFDYIAGKSSSLPKFNYDFSTLETNVHNDYIRWAKKHGIEYDQKVQKYEKYTISSIESVVHNKLDIMLLSHINTKNGFSTKLRDSYGMVKVIWIITFILSIASIAITYFLNFHRTRNLFYWLSIGFLSSGLMLAIPSVILKQTKYFDGLVLSNDAIYGALTKSLYAVTHETFLAGIILLALFVIFMFIYIALQNDLFKFKHSK